MAHPTAALSTRQLTLFDGPPPPAPVPIIPPHNGTPTSRAAAQAIAEHAPLQRARILEFMAERGAFGATCDEVESALGILPQSASARFAELREAGMIAKTNQRRPTRTGRSARVCIVIQ